MAGRKIISVRLDLETEKRIKEIKDYFEGYGPFVSEKITTGQIIRAAIYEYWFTITNKQNNL